jgi:hypothetical protein
MFNKTRLTIFNIIFFKFLKKGMKIFGVMNHMTKVKLVIPTIVMIQRKIVMKVMKMIELSKWNMIIIVLFMLFL